MTDACPTCHRPYATEIGRHAARRKDPTTSHAAVMNRAFGWNSMNGKALAIYASTDCYMTYHRVETIANTRWGAGALGKSPWKRCSELHTDFDPPLLDLLVNPLNGEPLEVPGEFGDPVVAYRINDEGRAWLARIYEGGSQS